jgi:cytochrome oxidase assembly protein ShyY1
MSGQVWAFYVVTPLLLEGSGAVVLVQRGWAPRNFVDREHAGGADPGGRGADEKDGWRPPRTPI